MPPSKGKERTGQCVYPQLSRSAILWYLFHLDILFQSTAVEGCDVRWLLPSRIHGMCGRKLFQPQCNNLLPSSPQTNDAFDPLEAIHAFHDCPRLRRLSACSLNPLQTSIAMKNLTFLSLSSFDVHCLTQLLMQCPLLETLMVEYFAQAQDPVQTTVALDFLVTDWSNKPGWRT